MKKSADNRIDRMSIKLALRVFSLFMIIILLSFGLTVRSIYQDAISAAHDNADTAMRQMVRLLDSSFAKLETATKVASGLVPDFSTDKPESCYDFLHSMLVSDSALAATCIMFIENYFPEEGREYCPAVFIADDGTVQHYDATDAGFTYLEDEKEMNWKNGVEGKNFWSEPYYMVNEDGRNQGLRVAYSLPLYNGNGLYGVLCAAPTLSWIDSRLDMYKPQSDCVVTLVENATGAYITNPDSTKILYRTVSADAEESDDDGLREIAELISRGEEGCCVSHHPQKQYVYVTPISRMGWSVVMQCPTASIYAGARSIVTAHSLLLVVVLLLLFALVTLAISRLVKPYIAVTESRAVLQRDLDIAAELQMGMLPKPALLESCGPLDVSAMLKPARFVGGDLYDYFLKGDRFYFCVGDVSGKGVPASMFMMVIITLLHGIADTTDDVRTIMHNLNANLREKNSDDMFCTLFLGVLDISTEKLSYCNAGHNRPVLVTRGGAGLMNLNPDVPIGLFDDVPYHSESVQMEPGDGIFLYTDGITEAQDAARSFYGEDAMLKVLAGSVGKKSCEIVADVIDDVSRFSGDTEQSDDITVLCIKYR